MSGSWRRIERSAEAKVIPAFSFTSVCASPAILYSTGFSTVEILTCSSFNSLRMEYSVVVLPEPVGPQMRMTPEGLAASRRRVWSSSSEKFLVVRLNIWLRLRKRITSFSWPPRVGMTDRRRSNSFSFSLTETLRSHLARGVHVAHGFVITDETVRY